MASEKPCAMALELTAPQMNCMLIVHELGQATIKQLAEQLHVSPPSASTMVDRLVEMGALLREQNPENRREVMVRLADKAVPELEVAEREFLQWLVELLDEMGPEYAAKWVDVYAHLRELLLRRSVEEKS